MKYLYLDIETIPVQDEERRKGIVANAKPPGNYSKPQAIADWRQTNADEIIGKTALDGAQGEIFCISFKCDVLKNTIWNSSGVSEDGVIRGFFSDIEHNIASYGETPVIVGHNILGFDLPFIRKRAMINGVKLPTWFPRDLKPWSNEVFDTMLQWDSKKFISMDNLARILGIDGKTDVDGSMVGKMYEEGRYQEIADYCAHDVSIVRQIHQKMIAVL